MHIIWVNSTKSINLIERRPEFIHDIKYPYLQSIQILILHSIAFMVNFNSFDMVKCNSNTCPTYKRETPHAHEKIK